MTAGKVSSANIDWASLGFSFIQTNGHLKYTWKDGKWDEGEFVSEPWVNMHIASSGLNYGQECFEGLKAWQCKDGKVRLFRPYNNADRLRYSASKACMVAPPRDLFVDAVSRIVKANLEYVPPYGSGGSLYIRPLLLGNGPMLNLVPSEEYTFIVYAVPVGNFYKDGIKTTNAIIIDDFDRGLCHLEVSL
ncbi:hypothetical protein K7432_015965 [Basidiobolus ranarum]|uniref:Uncharacterized protein n=1 Tax=Basidiobolus ranarum TaxID=34480 RepID=A0ABR2WFF5_9FUNG